MAKFEKGEKVRHSRYNQKGVIMDVLPQIRGRQIYNVYVDGEEQKWSELDIRADTNITDPYEKIKLGMFSSLDNFMLNNIIFKLQNNNQSIISSFKSSKTLFRAYQYIPLLKILKTVNRRLLVADEVGLGKTIEAGNIMLELMARGEMKTALVVCPNSLQEKWEVELREKFNLSFVKYDAKELTKAFRSHKPVMGIINYEKIRANEDDLCRVLEEEKIQIEMLICDEAHKLRNNSTKTHKSIEKIMDYTKAALFLTATPVMTDEENLYNLLHLLDREQYDNMYVFKNMLDENKPFVHALTQLSRNISLREIARGLESTTVGNQHKTIKDRYKGNPLYDRIIDELTNKTDTRENRVQLQYDMSSLSKLNNILSRTRKRDVYKDMSQPERDPKTLPITLYDEEKQLFDAKINQYYLECNQLDFVQKKRCLASSVYGFLNYEDNLKRGNDIYEGKPDAKVEKLIEIIREVVDKHGKKLIVFALFHNTLLYLRTRLHKKGIECALIYGETKNRQQVISEFQYDENIKILLSSEVGSEGLDMQFCDTIVNYDLPWNPMVVEQRIGRIDRFGQKSKKVHIYNLVVKGTIQEMIYSRLLDRIGIFKSSIGDLEAILDKYLEEEVHKDIDITKYFENLEYELYDPKLSAEERNRRIEDMRAAVLKEQHEIKDIEKNMDQWLTNDQSFRNELQRCQDHKLYITEKEEAAFLRQLINKVLTTCSLDEVDKERGIYVFRMPKNNPKILRQFLLSNEERGNSIFNMDFRSFNFATTSGDSDLYITFNQNTAFEDKKLHFVNSFHPLIRSALKYFKSEEGAKGDNTFRYSIKRKGKLNGLDGGTYFLALYRTEYRRALASQEQDVVNLVPVLYNWDRRQIIQDPELASLLMGEAQENASANNVRYEFNDEDINDMQYDMQNKAEKLFDDQFNEEKEKMDFQNNREIEHISEYYDDKINKIREEVMYYEERSQSQDAKEAIVAKRMLNLRRPNLMKYETEKEEKLHKMRGNKIEAPKSPVIISLSVVNLI